MRIETTDPISGNTIHNLDGKPFVVEVRAKARSRSTSRARPTKGLPRNRDRAPGKDFTTNLDNPLKDG